MRLTGFSSILVALFLYKKTTELPGVAALLPVLGTCLLLFSSNSRQDIIYKALTLTPVRFVGNISYSLYLWHWPLLVFARLMWSDLTRLDTVIALLIAVVLAMMTTYSFENPIRDRKILKSNHAFPPEVKDTNTTEEAANMRLPCDITAHQAEADNNCRPEKNKG